MGFFCLGHIKGIQNMIPISQFIFNIFALVQCGDWPCYQHKNGVLQNLLALALADGKTEPVEVVGNFAQGCRVTLINRLIFKHWLCGTQWKNIEDRKIESTIGTFSCLGKTTKPFEDSSKCWNPIIWDF